MAGEQVGAIYPGEVTLKIAAAEAANARAVPGGGRPDDLAARQGVVVDRLANKLRGKG